MPHAATIFFFAITLRRVDFDDAADTRAAYVSRDAIYYCCSARAR